MNVVAVTGRIATEIEVDVTRGGTATAEFTLAIENTYQPEEGEEIDRTAFPRVKLLGSKATFASQHLTKDDKINISGKLGQDHWADKETGKNVSGPIYITNITAVEFAESKADKEARLQKREGQG